METTIETPSTSAPAGGAPPQSYVQSLIGPADDLGLGETRETAPLAVPPAATAPGTAPGQPETKTTPPTETKPEDAAPPDKAAVLAELIQQFAKETGLNPEDPNQRKTLNRLANKELFIQKLQADLDAAKQPISAKPATEPELVTAFEKELAAEQTGTAAKPAGETPPAPPAAAPATEVRKPESAAGYGDIGDAWKTPEDSLSALNEAWTTNDLRKVHDIEVARLRRNFNQAVAPQLMPFIERLVEARLQEFSKKELGDILPAVRKSVSEQRSADSREFAINELRTAGAADIDKMFEKEDGPPIQFDGQEFPNSPLNRILAQNPEIMEIVKQHDDPVKAERATMLARFKLAYKLYKQQRASAGVPAEAAKQLVDAGRDAERNKEADRARQTLNAGSGATGLVEKPTNKSYAQELNNLPGAVPFSSLFSG